MGQGMNLQMDWREILEKRMKARRQILFSKDDDAMMSLHMLIDDMPKMPVAKRAILDCHAVAKEILLAIG